TLFLPDEQVHDRGEVRVADPCRIPCRGRPQVVAVRSFSKLPGLKRASDGFELLRSCFRALFPRDRPRAVCVCFEVPAPVGRGGQAPEPLGRGAQAKGACRAGRRLKWARNVPQDLRTLQYKVTGHETTPFSTLSLCTDRHQSSGLE